MKNIIKKVKNLIEFRDHYYYDFKYRVKMALYFFKYIWKNNYQVGLTPLKAELEYRKSHLLYPNRTKEIEEINTCIRLLEKVENEDYKLEYFDIIQQKYGEDVFEFEFVPTDATNKFFRMVYPFQENLSEKELETFLQEKKLLMKRFEEKHNKAKRILWKYYSEKVESWW